MTWSLLGILILVAYLSSLAEVHCDSLCTERVPTKRNEMNCNAYCNSRWGKADLVNTPWATGKCVTAKNRFCACSFNEMELQKFFPTRCFAKSGPYGPPIGSRKELAEQEYLRQIAAMQLENKFELYIRSYGKSYTSRNQKLQRMGIFKQNLIVIDRLNAEHKGKGNLVFGVGPFTDLTSKEFKSHLGSLHRQSSNLQPRGLRNWVSRMGSLRRSSTHGSNASSRRTSRSASLSPTRGEDSPSKRGRRGRSTSRDDPNANRHSNKLIGKRRSQSAPTPKKKRLVIQSPPTSGSLGMMTPPSSSRNTPPPWIGRAPEGEPEMDWRIPADIYPEVQNQVWWGKMCKSCWAFAVTAAIEMHWGLDQNKVTMLSAQDLVDCVEENNGCDGGNLQPTLEHIRRKGIAKAIDYPYEAETGRCFEQLPRYLRIDDYEQLTRQKDIEFALSFSPIPTGIHQPDELQHYVSGIYASHRCSNNKEAVDHAVTIVGHYKDAWIVRNTLGPDWGLQGHFLVEKGRCGIGHETFAIYSPELMPGQG